jgi:hypothetical protein
LKEFGVLKDTIKGTSSPKNVQTISFEGIHLNLKEFGVFFFVCFGCKKHKGKPVSGGQALGPSQPRLLRGELGRHLVRL